MLGGLVQTFPNAAPKKMMTKVSVDKWDAAISNMLRSLLAYFEGDPYAYRAVAVELRKLLCDTKFGKENSLLVRDDPGYTLHPLASTLLKDMSFIDGPFFVLPGPAVFDGRRSGFLGSLFNEKKDRVALEEWREQNVVTQKITIRSLIKSVADREGAHADGDSDSTLDTVKFFSYGEQTVDAEIIVSIGRYVLRQLLLDRVLRSCDALLKWYGERTTEHGCGALRLSLGGSPLPYRDGLALGYLTLAAACEVLKAKELANETDLAALMAQVRGSSFLLWMDDLQGNCFLDEIDVAERRVVRHWHIF